MRHQRLRGDVSWPLAVFSLAVMLSGCAPEGGGEPERVRQVVEQAAAARDAGDFAIFSSLFVGEKAGRYRQVLKTTYQDDPRAFFADKRTMVITGPVDIRRRAFATVRLFVVHGTGYKPYQRAAVVFQDGRWLIDSFVPGDLELRDTTRADADGIVQLLATEVLEPRPAGPEGTFRRIQILQAMEVVATRLLPEAVDPLMDLLTMDADADVRQFAADLIGRLGDRRAVPALEDALDDPDLRVRGDAVAALGQLGSAAMETRLSTMARQDVSPWVQQQARSALAKLGTAAGG